jgi:hypothetical protein
MHAPSGCPLLVAGAQTAQTAGGEKNRASREGEKNIAIGN